MTSLFTKHKGPARRLTPSELAEAAVLADLTVVVVIVTRLTPLATFTQVLGCVPFAVLAMRHNRRVVSVAFWIAFTLTFLLAGYGEASNVVIMAVWGTIAGIAVRNNWGWGKSFLWSLTVGWVTTSVITLGFLAILSRFRKLWLEFFETQMAGIIWFLRRLSGLLQYVLPDGAVQFVLDDGLIAAAEPSFAWALRNWWFCVPVVEFFFGIWMTFILRRLTGPIAGRVNRTFRSPDVERSTQIDRQDKPLPLPIHIENQTIAAGGSDLYSIRDLSINPGELVALTGPNGAGKSTLLRALADLTIPGVAKADQGIDRPGRPGLGEPSGTALIGQRPESQVLGARVIDDLRWGRRSDETINETEALAKTGLAGFEHRETSTLSGGELQRLAIAGMLIRTPQLILSDESTSMLDPDGRAQVMELLQELTRDGATVIHTTHFDSEARMADRILHIEDSELVEL